MTRVAVYARVSTDKQKESTVEAQVAKCREYAKERDWLVVRVERKVGVSGASRHNRPNLLSLVRDLEEWDVLLCTEFSRLARDTEDSGWLRNQLRAREKKAVEAFTGRDLEDLASRFVGVVDETEREKVKARTHLGLESQVKRGFSAGAKPYGYRSEPAYSGKTDRHGQRVPDGYRVVVHEEEAAIVRRIFDLYLSGLGVKAVATLLNDEAVPPPRPTNLRNLKRKSWAHTGVRVILSNQLYTGLYVWNKTRKVKDHASGKRRVVYRPEKEWVKDARPELRVVDCETFAAVQRELSRRAAERGAQTR